MLVRAPVLMVRKESCGHWQLWRQCRALADTGMSIAEEVKVQKDSHQHQHGRCHPNTMKNPTQHTRHETGGASLAAASTDNQPQLSGGQNN